MKDGAIEESLQTALGNVKIDESMSFVNDSKFLNETIDMKNHQQMEEAHIRRSIEKRSYAHLFDEDAKGCEDVVTFLYKVK